MFDGDSPGQNILGFIATEDLQASRDLLPLGCEIDVFHLARTLEMRRLNRQRPLARRQVGEFEVACQVAFRVYRTTWKLRDQILEEEVVAISLCRDGGAGQRLSVGPHHAAFHAASRLRKVHDHICRLLSVLQFHHDGTNHVLDRWHGPFWSGGSDFASRPASCSYGEGPHPDNRRRQRRVEYSRS